jgi:hypothetical protein
MLLGHPKLHAMSLKLAHPLTTPACCRRAQKQRAFMYKVWSLASSSFQQALLLDADNLPLVNPEGAAVCPMFWLLAC